MLQTIRISGFTSIFLALLSSTVLAQDAAFSAAVRMFDPHLSVPSAGSLVHRADFTGDGRSDVAAILRGPRGSSLVVFNATGDGFQPHPLYSTLPPGEVELKLLSPGRYGTLGERGSVQLDHPAVEIIFPGRSSAIYAWRNGRYEVYPTESYF